MEHFSGGEMSSIGKSLSQFTCFDAVARNLGFAVAARELGMAPSSVAKSIARLESQLGMKLFRRTTRSVSLTPEGELLFKRTSRILEELASLEAFAGQQLNQPEGELRISAPVGYGSRVVVPVVAKMLRVYPHMTADVRLSDERLDLTKEGLDAVIRFGSLADSQMIARKFDEQPLVLCASPGYLESRGIPKTPKELEGHDIVAFRMPTTGRDRPLEFLEGSQRVVVKSKPRLRMSHGAGIADALREGCGIGQIPMFMAEELIERGDLLELMPDYRPDSLDVNIVTPGRRTELRRVDVLIEMLRSARSKGP